MRFLFVVLVGAIGWLWYAARAPVDAPPAPAQVRRADLTGLGAQVAAARSAVMPAMPELEPEETNERELDEIQPDLDALAEQVELAVFDRPPPADAIDLADQLAYQAIIQIEGHAPIIDTSRARHSDAFVEEYTKHIPLPGRTFEGSLDPTGDEVAPVRTFGLGPDEVITISSGPHLGNEYYVDGDDEPAAIDQPAIDQPAIDQPAIDQALEIMNKRIEDIEANGGSIY
jgi:hypothetical protein